MRTQPSSAGQNQQYSSLTAPLPLERRLGARAPLLALVALGIALRVWQYASNPSFWMDEISLSRNILGLPLHDLILRPLSYDQVAPRGFLLVEKLMSLAFGPSELTLRLMPLVVSIVGMILFWRLAERMLEGPARYFAVFAFAIAIPLVKYAAEVKQYGGDATVATGLVLVALRIRDPDTTVRRLWLAGLAGLVLVWFSQAAVIVLAGLGAVFAVEWLVTRDRQTLLPLVITVPLWAVASLLAVVSGLRSMTPSTKAFMNNFWAAGFLPWPVRLPSGLGWLWNSWLGLFSDRWVLRYPWPALFVVLAALGMVALWRHRRDHALVLLGTLVVALVAAAFHQYPFYGRVDVYLIPGLLIAAAAGADWARRALGRVSPALGNAAMLACVVPPVKAVIDAPPPYVMEDYRAVFTYLRDHRQPGDSVYVLFPGHSAAIFYGPRYGLQQTDWTMPACNREDVRPFLRDLDRYRGASRVWVFMTGLRPLRVVRASVRSYLSTIGTRRDSLFAPSLVNAPTSLELYDLSDPARLRAASAETFPVQPMPTDPRPGCRNLSAPPGR